MTEAEWMACGTPEPLVRHRWSINITPSDRQLRLCMIAWCWRIKDAFHFPEAESFVLSALEQWADSSMPLDEYLTRWSSYDGFGGKKMPSRSLWYIEQRDGLWWPNRAVMHAATHEKPIPMKTLLSAGLEAARNWGNYHCRGVDWEDRPEEEYDAFVAPLEVAERNAQAQLLRHIFGNPFGPYPAPACWPLGVVELARSLYEGGNNRVILADALEEGGHLLLADHFRAEDWHPKGCWVADLLLGKE